MSNVIIYVGVLGSGKSTWSTQFIKDTPKKVNIRNIS